MTPYREISPHPVSRKQPIMKPTVSSSSAGAFALAAGLTAAVIYCLKDQQQQAAESAKTKRVREELTLEEERDRRFALAASSSRTNRRARYLQQQSRDGVERSETRRNLILKKMISELKSLLPRGASVLDVGSGDGKLIEFVGASLETATPKAYNNVARNEAVEEVNTCRNMFDMKPCGTTRQRCVNNNNNNNNSSEEDSSPLVHNLSLTSLATILPTIGECEDPSEEVEAGAAEEEAEEEEEESKQPQSKCQKVTSRKSNNSKSNDKRKPLAVHRFDGKTLPEEDGAFDVVTCLFELHHCNGTDEEQEQLCRELCRVSKRYVVVGEDSNEPQFRERNLLRDVNGRFRTRAEWSALFASLGLRVLHESACIPEGFGPQGPQCYFIMEKVDAKEDAGAAPPPSSLSTATTTTSTTETVPAMVRTAQANPAAG